SDAETDRVTGIILWLGGQRRFGAAIRPAIVGGVASPTVTVVVATAGFAEASWAVNVTVVVPIGNTAGASLLTVAEPSQLSVALGTGTETAAPAALVHSATIGPGTPLKTGPVWSATVTWTSSVSPHFPSLTVSRMKFIPRGRVTVGVGPLAPA